MDHFMYTWANSMQYILAIDLKALLSPALSILPASQFKGLIQKHKYSKLGYIIYRK
jgi:hypothetical protein